MFKGPIQLDYIVFVLYAMRIKPLHNDSNQPLLSSNVTSSKLCAVGRAFSVNDTHFV